MIIRKPYAFLIKNFRKIHILLLVLCAFVFYHIMQLRNFVSTFLSLGVYDAYNEPVTKYINFFVIISLIVIIVITFIVISLLRHKGKPWKLYLIIIAEYLFMFVVLVLVYNYFHSYSGSTETAGPRLLKDLLFMSSIPQYVVFIILLIRVTGVDLAKFDFKGDSEYLELSSSDREEIEINIDIDKESFKRLFKRLKRNLGYFYAEHKFFVNVFVTVIFIGGVIYIYNYVFIVNKIYKQGEVLNTNNAYSIRINNSYFTNKDYAGTVISEDSNFVVVDLTIKNNASKREVNLGRYHLMNGVNNYTHTSQTYSNDFKDLGKSYELLEMKNGEEINLVLIYKVDKKLDYSRFVMYYQDFNNKDGNSYIRKIRLNVEDVSKIKEKDSDLKLKDTLEFQLLGKKNRVIFDSVEFSNLVNYSYSDCYTRDCYFNTGEVSVDNNYKILILSYASNQLDGKDMVDFSTGYGKINYMNSSGKDTVIDMVSAVKRDYYGKYLYLKVPAEVELSNSISLNYTVRDTLYKYKLR